MESSVRMNWRQRFNINASPRSADCPVAPLAPVGVPLRSMAQGYWTKTLRRTSALVSVSVMAALPAAAALPVESSSFQGFIDGLDPTVLGFAGLFALTIASVLWAVRVSIASKTISVDWSRNLAQMEADLEKTGAILSAHPGLVLVWEDDVAALAQGWGDPRILGGPAALASLLSFSNGLDPLADPQTAKKSPVSQLLDTLGDLPLEDDGKEPKTLREKVADLRAHGIPFSGAVVTLEGRAIEADGRVAGSQVGLWLTDPAARMAEDDGVLGKIRERSIDLHSALSFMEKTTVPTWRRDADFDLVWVNRAYCEAVESNSPSEVLRKQIELDPAAKKIAEQASQTRQRAMGQVVVNIDGNRRVLRIIETPMHSAGGSGIGGIALDITDLDRSKRELADHVEANRKILDEIPSAVALFEVDQSLSYYNQAFQDLWGFDDADLVGRPTHGEILDDLDHGGKLPERGADYRAWRETQLDLYTGDLPEPGSERDGGAPVELWNLPDGRAIKVMRERHTLGGVLLVFEDVTEKLKLETKYNTQMKVQRSTLNNLAEGVAVFASDGSLRLFNEAFRELWRFGRDFLDSAPHVDAILKKMSTLVPETDPVMGSIKQRIISMSPEHRQPLKDREVNLRDGRTLAMGTEPLPDGASLIYFLDITDSREREKELKERNEILEAVGHLKSKFADHVSHQLRTPLATIVGFTEMLESQMFGVLNDRQKDYIADILTASYHLRDLIDDVIDLTAIDAGQMALEIGKVDLRQLVESAATYAALKAEDTRVNLKVACARDIGVIEADEQRLKQVLFNLLSNSFAYTDQGGQVTIGADRTADMARLWVEDNGRGVSPEDQAKAFDAFESRGPSAGVGLGLSLVERFVKLHGGFVRLESAPGKGTKVTCHLPISPRAAHPQTAAPVDTAASNRGEMPKPGNGGGAPKAKRPRNRTKTTTKRQAKQLASAKDANTESGAERGVAKTPGTPIRRKKTARRTPPKASQTRTLGEDEVIDVTPETESRPGAALAPEPAE
ncbi:MAG: ATP-binding protein [Pseudomonadota bacterium]